MDEDWLDIDGSRGEGGGQILRSSLTLSLVTGRPIRLLQIRAGRERPGLQPQHLMAVEAAARVGNAAVSGATAASIAPSRRWTCQSSGRRSVTDEVMTGFHQSRGSGARGCARRPAEACRSVAAHS